MIRWLPLRHRKDAGAARPTAPGVEAVRARIESEARLEHAQSQLQEARALGAAFRLARQRNGFAEAIIASMGKGHPQ